MAELTRNVRALAACAAVVGVAWLLVVVVSGGLYWGTCVTTPAISPPPAHCDTAFRTFTLFSLVGMALACAAAVAVGLGGTVRT